MEQISGIADLLTESNVRYFSEDDTIFDIINTMLSSTVSVDRISGDCGLFIVDLSVVIDKYRQWCELLPRVKPYYAVKSNPDPCIIKVLSILGANFDCASKQEIQQVLTVCPASRIIFANPAKFDAHLRFARSVDVDVMVIDNVGELIKIAHFHPNADLILRIQVDDSHSKCKFNKKFGAQMQDIDEIFKVAKTLQTCTKLSIVGVSFHVGSGCMNVTAFETAIAQCRKVFDVAKQYGHIMTILDIGGGFPGSDDADGIPFRDFATQINQSLDRHFPDYSNQSDDDTSQSGPTIKVIAEPGRYFCSASHTLVLNVVAKNTRVDANGNKKFMYTVNDGVYGSFNCIMFDHAKPVIKPFNERDGETYECVVYGPTCDSMDTISENCLLPDLAIGEYVYIQNIGAYSSAAASQFNGFKRTPSEYIIRRPP